MKQLYCSIFGHDYQISKEVTYHVKEYTCKHCKEQVTTNGSGKLTLLTPKYKEINSVLERIHNNRISKKQLKQDKVIVTIDTDVLLNFTPHHP